VSFPANKRGEAKEIEETKRKQWGVAEEKSKGKIDAQLGYKAKRKGVIVKATWSERKLSNIIMGTRKRGPST